MTRFNVALLVCAAFAFLGGYYFGGGAAINAMARVCNGPGEFYADGIRFECKKAKP